MAHNTSNDSKRSMAAPSLNMYQKIAVIRKPNDSLTYEDNEGNVKSVSVEQLGDAISNATPLVAPKPKLDIPIPKINDVTLPKAETYKPPRAFVRYQKPTPEEWAYDIHYLSDIEDEEWLKSNDKFGGSTPFFLNDNKLAEKDKSVETLPKTEIKLVERLVETPRLPIEMFEILMDIMEKETAFDTIITTNQAEEAFQKQIPQLFELFPGKAQPGTVTVKRVIQDVYNYWVNKRSKLRRPLLRQFWPVTSTGDTNPHLVFRPREKEKYKLRKKRQNDMDAYRKMKQLRADFENLRTILDLTLQREKLCQSYVSLQVELTQQRIYEMTNTSGEPRESTTLSKSKLNELCDNPAPFDPIYGGRKAKRKRPGNDVDYKSSSSMLRSDQNISGALSGGPNRGDLSKNSASAAARQAVAGINNGNPAPKFLHPLDTRQYYATSYDNTVPHITSYVDAQAEATYLFSHRPRVGRGGRICIDRVPLPVDPSVAATTVYTAGVGMQQHTQPKHHLLDLLPKPLDYSALSRKIEELSVAAIQDDVEARVRGSRHGGLPEENDGEEVIVDEEDWLDTDDQRWGEERYSLDAM